MTNNTSDLLVDAILDLDRPRIAAILASGADPNLPDSEGDYPIILAIDREIYSSDEDWKGKWWKGFKGQLPDGETVQMLLDAGADPNVVDPETGYTPLDFASTSHPEAYKILKRHGGIHGRRHF
jgi:ankyrin repeat protein